MLPDLRTVKRRLQAHHLKVISDRAQARLGVFSEVPKHFIHEGDCMVTYRADGTVEESAMMTTSAEGSLAVAQVANLTEAERFDFLDRMAERMAEAMARELYGSLDRTLEAAGQVVHGGGKGFTAELFLQMIDKVEMEFDEAGQMKNMVIAAHPSARPELARIAAEIESDPALSQRHREIMQRKLEAYNAREAARKLVG